mmetsp:Transcript_5207/g.15361  ORF Transcript_5207/g.15361 Transcript_5207/m.15361 type:complete len:229 (-) Transcript_5207:926-1612(-)
MVTRGTRVPSWKTGKSCLAIENIIIWTVMKKKCRPTIRNTNWASWTRASRLMHTAEAWMTTTGSSWAKACPSLPEAYVALKVLLKHVAIMIRKKKHNPHWMSIERFDIEPSNSEGSARNLTSLSWPMMPPPSSMMIRTYCVSVTPTGPAEVCRTPVWNSSHWARKKPNWKSVVPSRPEMLPPGARTACAWEQWMIEARQSQPWSKSCPRGVEEPVRRACFPSIASSVW